jgi:hypothetical protein
MRKGRKKQSDEANNARCIAGGFTPSIDPVAQPSGNPDFLYAALDTTACAAFIRESRINFANATKLHTKSWGRRDDDRSPWVKS